MPSAMKCVVERVKMNEFRWFKCMVWDLKLGCVVLWDFSQVPTTHTQAPAVPVCGWWAKGKDDGALGTRSFFVCAMPAWMGTGGKEVVHTCPG